MRKVFFFNLMEICCFVPAMDGQEGSIYFKVDFDYFQRYGVICHTRIAAVAVFGGVNVSVEGGEQGLIERNWLRHHLHPILNQNQNYI